MFVVVNSILKLKMELFKVLKPKSVPDAVDAASDAVSDAAKSSERTVKYTANDVENFVSGQEAKQAAKKAENLNDIDKMWRTQYHPEYKSTVNTPAPLFVAFVAAALKYDTARKAETAQAK